MESKRKPKLHVLEADIDEEVTSSEPYRFSSGEEWLDDAVYHTVGAVLAAIRECREENSIPLAETLTYSDVHDFILAGKMR